MSFLRVFSLFILFLQPLQAHAFLCFDQLAYAHRIYRPGVDDQPIENAIQIAQPTQHLLGKPRIVVFSEELLSMEWNQLRREVEKRPVPYVLGPNGRRHIIDRHHTLYTFQLILPELKRRGFPVHKLKIEFRQVEDYSSLGMNKFHRKMLERGFLYPLNKQGIEDPTTIPSHVSLLEFDFYRGLSWIVRKSGAVEKNVLSVPYLEFYWAKLIKEEFSFKNETLTRKKIRKAIEFALAREGVQTDLPGYRQTLPKDMNVETCLQKIEPILLSLERNGLLEK